MPSREDVLDSIEATPYKNLDRLKPRRIINDFLKGHNTYNNRLDLPEISGDDESLSDFIVDDVTPTSTKHQRRTKKIREERCKHKRRRVQALESDSDLEEGTPQKKKRQSSRIKKQPKKEFHKPSKKEVLKKILEREPDLNEVIESDDAEDFVDDTDEDGATSDVSEDLRINEPSSEGEVEEVKNDGSCKQDECVKNGLSSCERNATEVTPNDSKSSKSDNINGGLQKYPSGNSNSVCSENEDKSDSICCNSPGKKVEKSSSTKDFLLSEEVNSSNLKMIHPSPKDDSSSEDESNIRTSSRLRSKVHRKSQQSKTLDSGESESEDEVNTSFAKRETKRKTVCVNSDEDD